MDSRELAGDVLASPVTAAKHKLWIYLFSNSILNMDCCCSNLDAGVRITEERR